MSVDAWQRAASLGARLDTIPEVQGADRCSGQDYTITWFPLAPKE